MKIEIHAYVRLCMRVFVVERMLGSVFVSKLASCVSEEVEREREHREITFCFYSPSSPSLSQSSYLLYTFNRTQCSPFGSIFNNTKKKSSVFCVQNNKLLLTIRIKINIKRITKQQEICIIFVLVLWSKKKKENRK